MAPNYTTTALLLLLVAIVAANTAADKSSSSTPATDCSTVIISLTDCLTYVTNGSTLKKPQGTCCSGLKTVLKTNAQCLCEEFSKTGQLGISIDIARALTMPDACHIPSPGAGLCGTSLLAPKASPAAAPAEGPSSSVLSGGTVVTPAPAPNKAASTFAVSAGSFIVVLAAAAFSYL
ncbi:Non-specific lipid transfer protein GPI-anchored 11-like protein [Drosera capensis]